MGVASGRIVHTVEKMGLLRMIALLGAGVCVSAYWYRVVHMALKARRRSGHAGNLIPPEKLGRALRLLWTPAIAVWVIHPFLSALQQTPSVILQPVVQMTPPAEAVLDGTAFVVIAACLAATTLCWRKMGTSWRMGINPAEKTQLIASGPFAYVRHPIYALSIVMMLWSMFAIRSPLMIVAGGIHIGLIVWESIREERHMLRVHGEDYARYRRRTGRFIPARARPPACP